MARSPLGTSTASYTRVTAREATLTLKQAHVAAIAPACLFQFGRPVYSVHIPFSATLANGLGTVLNENSVETAISGEGLGGPVPRKLRASARSWLARSRILGYGFGGIVTEGHPRSWSKAPSGLAVESATSGSDSYA